MFTEITRIFTRRGRLMLALGVWVANSSEFRIRHRSPSAHPCPFMLMLASTPPLPLSNSPLPRLLSPSLSQSSPSLPISILFSSSRRLESQYCADTTHTVSRRKLQSHTASQVLAMSITSPLSDLHEPIDVIGNGSFGIIWKVRPRQDGAVSNLS